MVALKFLFKKHNETHVGEKQIHLQIKSALLKADSVSRYADIDNYDTKKWNIILLIIH